MTDSVELGRLEENGDGRWRLRFTRLLAHPLDVVWRAVSAPEQLAAWFPTTVEGERAAGAKLRFSFPQGQAEAFDGEMLAFEPPSLIEFGWGPDVIRIELHPVPGGTELTLIHIFAERGKGARDAAGWHVCLSGLAAYLAGDPAPEDAMAEWKAIHPRYVAHFGPEAAVIGPPEGV